MRRRMLSAAPYAALIGGREAASIFYEAPRILPLARFVRALSEITGEQAMHLRFWLFVAAAGGLAHLVLFIADRQIGAGVDRLADNDLSAAGSEFLRPLIDLMPEGAGSQSPG